MSPASRRLGDFDTALAGREVVLTEDGWAHILDGHDQMVGREADVRATVESPEIVAADATYPNRECHYRRPAPDRANAKVVVRYWPVPLQGTSAGEVVTAHPTQRIGRREPQLWP